ncbi:MAG: isoaspartyl peptidase, partial [Leptolyngbyaceae cyanobacterium RM2_2_21]|nr:isoaspartyl peptidase [Leptolyngbyaceae cyanobacterium RM2_2_21]
MTGGIEPKLIIHGGAGSAIKSEESLIAVRHELHQIVETVYQKLAAGEDAKSAVVLACRLLEDNPRFNAGTGSVLQSDGQIRMSAALMDGAAQRFSGVINASRLQHPIDLAEHLQTFHDRVLSDYGAADLMRELGTPLFDPLTELRLQEWLRERSEGFKHEMAGVVAE